MINSALHSRQYCSVSVLDLSKAFDEMWHVGLLYKIKEYLYLCNILIPYLHNKKFYVSGDNMSSELKVINAGITHGMLFLSYFLNAALLTILASS